MSTHNICFHREIRKKVTFWLTQASYLELWPEDLHLDISRFANVKYQMGDFCSQNRPQQKASHFLGKTFFISHLLYLPQIFQSSGLCKQCRLRSDASKCGIKSGTTLFPTHPADLWTHQQVVKWMCSNFWITSV